MKYKIGDKVRIREDIGKKDIIDGFFITERMLKYRGKVLTISGFNNKVYRFAELSVHENDSVFFTDHMMTFIPKPKYNVGDKVTIKKGLDANIRYGGVAMIPYMCLQGGKTFTIKEIDYTTFSVPTYRFNETGCYWTNEMLEDRIEDIEITDPMSIVENGNIVQVACGEYFLYLNGKGFTKNGYTEFKQPMLEIVKIWKIADSGIYSSWDLANPENCKGDLIWEKPLTTREMTVSEIEKTLGYEIKVIKEENEYEF